MEKGRRKGALDDVNDVETCKKETEESLSLSHTHSPSSSLSSSLENGEITTLSSPPNADRRPHFSNCGDICRFYNLLLFHKVSCDAMLSTHSTFEMKKSSS